MPQTWAAQEGQELLVAEGREGVQEAGCTR